MSGNRKRGGGGNILDQLEPRSARSKAKASSFSIGIEPRWVWAGGGAISLLVAALAAIAWSTTTTARALPQAREPLTAPVLAQKPVFEEGPAKVERVAHQSGKAAPILLAKVEPPPMPPPMPLVVLPRDPATRSAAKVVRAPPAQKAEAARSASRPPVQNQAAARRTLRKPPRAKPEPVPEAAQEADSDVALIRAIRKATQSRQQ